MKLNKRQTATVLAALRLFQKINKNAPHAPKGLAKHFEDVKGPLGNDSINNLCTQIDLGERKFRFIVPVVHIMEFGLEVEVEAETLEEAKLLAMSPNAEIASGDGYDWDRQEVIAVRMGYWQEIKKLD